MPVSRGDLYKCVDIYIRDFWGFLVSLIKKIITAVWLIFKKKSLMHVEMEWRRAFKPLFLKKIDAECDYLFSMGDKQLFNTIKILAKSCDFPILKAFISIPFLKLL